MRDLRYVLRSLWHHRALTATAVLTLALGIGANTALFSVVNAVLLRPLPLAHADRLAVIWEVDARATPIQERNFVSVATFGDWRRLSRAFEQMAAFNSGPQTLVDEFGVTRITTGYVSADFMATVGVSPALGRAFAEGEDQPGRRNVTVISHALWQQRYAGDPQILGRTVQFDGDLMTIIGVLPAEFDFLDRQHDAWMPISLPPSDFDNRRTHRLQVVGRLREDATIAEAQAELDTVMDRLRTADPQWLTGFGVNVVPLREEVVGEIRPILLVLFGAVGCVLLIALVNVASLLLGRASARQRELAIRAALGAGRRHLVKQGLVEGLVLAVLGGGAGLLVASFGTRALLAFDTGNVPRSGEVGLDASVLFFTASISLVVGLAFSLVPSLQRRGDLGLALKEGDRATAGGRRERTFRNTLIVAEVALSLVLLIGAGLMVRTMVSLMREDPGFAADSVLTATVALPDARYPDRQAVYRFFDDLTNELQAAPGVESVGLTRFLPLSSEWTFSFFIDGQPLPQEGEKRDYGMRMVDVGYFRTMGIRLRAGRLLTERDYGDAPPVVVINEAMGRRFWPGEELLGKRIRFGRPFDDDPTWIEVVGVVADVKHAGVDLAAPPALYVPYAQNAVPMGLDRMTIAVRAQDTAGAAGELRRLVEARDPELLVADVATMRNVVAASFADRRLTLVLLGLFAGLAAVLAAVGIYGVIAYVVGRRTSEIGLRMALGATPGGITRLVIAEAMSPVTLGLAIGLGTAAVASRALTGLLFGVQPLDPVTFAGVAATLAAIAATACYLPARSASTVDPADALRSE